MKCANEIWIRSSDCTEEQNGENMNPGESFVVHSFTASAWAFLFARCRQMRQKNFLTVLNCFCSIFSWVFFYSNFVQEDIVCLTLPMSHPLGCIAGTLAAVTFGRTLVLPAPVFDPTTAFKAIKDNKCVTLFGLSENFLGEAWQPEKQCLACRRCTAVYGTPSALAQLPQIEADQSKASTLRKGNFLGHNPGYMTPEWGNHWWAACKNGISWPVLFLIFLFLEVTIAPLSFC